MTDSPQNTDSEDALIQNVRHVREQVCVDVGNDVDRLAAALRETRASYASRIGVFAGVSEAAARRVEQSWVQLEPAADPLIGELRAARSEIARAASDPSR